MYAGASEIYESVINGYSRHFQARLKKDGETVNAEIKRHATRKYSSTGEDISIGSAFSSSVEISCITVSFLKDSEVTLETGLEISSGEYEYVPDGVYTIVSQKKKGEINTLVGYDRMYVNGSKTFGWPIIPARYSELVSELASQLGVTFDPDCLEAVEDFTIEDFIDSGGSGYTLQEMAGYLAGLIGRNAYIDRTGQLTFQAYVDSGYVFDGNRISDIDLDQTARTINWLQCTVGDDTLQSGTGAGYVKMANPLMTEKILDNVAGKIPISYYGAEAAFLLGDPRLDPWDLIHYKVKMAKDTLVDEDGAVLVDEFGNVFADWDDGLIPILCHEIVYSFDGGLSMDITSYALSETEENTDSRGPVQKAAEEAQQAASEAKERVANLDKKLTAEEIFNRLTENGTLQGIYKDEETGEIYINASYIVSGILSGDIIRFKESINFSDLIEVFKLEKTSRGIQLHILPTEEGEAGVWAVCHVLLSCIYGLSVKEGLTCDDITVTKEWTPLTLEADFENHGTYERAEVSCKKIGKHVYIDGAVKLTGTFSGKSMAVATLPEECWPAVNRYAIAACGGARIARIIVTPDDGVLHVEWIKKLADGATDTTTAGLWVSMKMDYWID